ncbi:hypothetical protein I4U23_005317 [Adineta vaga]|nr:hypothetical protein I4U23_005317 [Adineta vaga]
MLIYRKEIDGLRALAILPVILYHAGFVLLVRGGYVGVDIFFVISGYLITSIVDVELSGGTFSLIGFYEKRCCRILPALYVILCITCSFAYQWMSPSKLREFGYSLIFIATFSSNIFFWWKDDNYFSHPTEFNPVIHTWSVAVAEQFYLLFPFLCYLFARKRRYLFVLLGYIALLSFYFAQWGGNIHSIPNMTFYMFLQHSWASFYMPIGRIWELLLGAFIFALIGISLIIASVLLLDNRSIPPFPNCYTIVPTFGTALIIIYGKRDTLVGRLLSTRLLCWIGRISYSVYLWHQPLLVYLRLQRITMTNVSNIMLVVGAVFLLATLTYIVIEQPFRNRILFTQKQIFIGSAVGALLLVLIAVFLIRTADHRSLIATKSGHNRSLNLEEEEVDTYMQDIEPIELSNYVTRRFNNLMEAHRTFSVESATTNRRLLLIGDSFAQDFMNMMVETHFLPDYEVRCHYVRVFCQIYMGPEDRLQWIPSAQRQLCINDNDIRLALPLIKQANVIILAAHWFEWSAQRLPTTIKSLQLSQSQKLFVIGVKNFGLVNRTLFIHKSYKYRVQQFLPPLNKFVKLNTMMKRILNPLIFVDVLSMTCVYDNGTCPIFTEEGKIISYDGEHTTKYGA